jgi:hypothetical protein
VVEQFAVSHVCASPVRFRSPAYRRILSGFSERQNFLRTLSGEEKLGNWEVLHPQAQDRFSKADDGAMVLRGTFDGVRVLLLSDLGRTGQDLLLERHADLRADIVVTGQPTTGEPLCEGLLDAIRPRIVIFADSEYPVTERARERVRERLGCRECPVVYTRSSGAATIEFHRGNWELRTMNGPNSSSRSPLLKLKEVTHHDIAPDPPIGEEDEESAPGS